MMEKLKPNTIMFLLKFVQRNSKYIDDFKNGNLYFTPLRQFIDLEKKQKNHKTGDRYEGTVHRNINNLQSLTIDGYKVNINDVLNMSLEDSIPDAMLDNFGICSFFAVCFEDIEKISDNSNTYRIKNSTLNDIKKTKDGDRVLFGVNNVKALAEESISLQVKDGLVKYYDPNNIKACQIRDYAKMFYKLEKYKYQHEFRFIKDISDGNNYLHFNTIEKFKFNAENMIFDNIGQY